MEHTKERPMTATTMTLAEFLRARLDEDEAVAFGGAPSPWKKGEWDGEFDGPREVLDRHGDVTARAYYGGTYGHVLRFDPTRVLAEVEAKRRIVERHSPHWYTIGGHWECAVCGGHFTAARDVVCADLRLLALPYADHPDHRDEWRP